MYETKTQSYWDKGIAADRYRTGKIADKFSYRDFSISEFAVSSEFATVRNLTTKDIHHLTIDGGINNQPSFR